jgi:D-alanine-D-alanine ligase
MRIAVLYNQPGEDAAVDETDVFTQRDAVAQSLSRLGHDVNAIGCTLDLAGVRTQLLQLQPEVVFNLVESLGGTDRLMPLATLLLDALQIPYTGSPTAAILATIGKLSAKEQMAAAGLPTPAWHTRGVGLQTCPNSFGPARLEACSTRAILKPVWEHASFGMDEKSVVTFSEAHSLDDLLALREAHTGRPYFAEAFIDGREFNLSLLAGNAAAGSSDDDGTSWQRVPTVLPPAEIDFSAFARDRLRIVDYRAKWAGGTFEYENTPRRFDFAAHDGPLLHELTELAMRCWELFELRGYARVDFRVDTDGRPWILEINVNPCLSPDAGFAAALAAAGISYDEAVSRIVADAICE